MICFSLYLGIPEVEESLLLWERELEGFAREYSLFITIKLMSPGISG